MKEKKTLLGIVVRSNPDYYETEKQPIDLTTIQKNAKSGKYQSMEQFAADMSIMVENEKLYHRVSSYFPIKIIDKLVVFTFYHDYVLYRVISKIYHYSFLIKFLHVIVNFSD